METGMETSWEKVAVGTETEMKMMWKRMAKMEKTVEGTCQGNSP
jgi:hypothetical protein